MTDDIEAHVAQAYANAVAQDRDELAAASERALRRTGEIPLASKTRVARQARRGIAVAFAMFALAGGVALASENRVQRFTSLFDIGESAPATDLETSRSDVENLAGPAGVPDAFGELQAATSGKTMLDHTQDPWHARIWGTGTSKDAICFVVSSVRTDGTNAGGHSGTCAQSLGRDFPVIHLASATNGYFEVAGVFAGDVREVVIELQDGTSQKALVGEHAFYWGASDTDETPEAITLTFRSGELMRRSIREEINGFAEVRERSRLAAMCMKRFGPDPDAACAALGTTP